MIGTHSSAFGRILNFPSDIIRDSRTAAADRETENTMFFGYAGCNQFAHSSTQRLLSPLCTQVHKGQKSAFPSQSRRKSPRIGIVLCSLYFRLKYTVLL